MAPIKEKMRRRSDALAGYRNIHHHALLFCNRLTCGLSRGLPICVMGYYCEWFYSNCLEDYLYREEQLIFPVVGYGSAEVKFSRACHVQIRQLFGERNKTYTNLAAIVSATASYIRFASLTLIPDAEKLATRKQLLRIGWDNADFPVAVYHERFWDDHAKVSSRAIN